MTWRQFIDTYAGDVLVIYWYTAGSQPLPRSSTELRRVVVTRAEAVEMLKRGGEE